MTVFTMLILMVVIISIAGIMAFDFAETSKKKAIVPGLIALIGIFGFFQCYQLGTSGESQLMNYVNALQQGKQEARDNLVKQSDATTQLQLKALYASIDQCIDTNSWHDASRKSSEQSWILSFSSNLSEEDAHQILKSEEEYCTQNLLEKVVETNPKGAEALSFVLIQSQYTIPEDYQHIAKNNSEALASLALR